MVLVPNGCAGPFQNLFCILITIHSSIFQQQIKKSYRPEKNTRNHSIYRKQLNCFAHILNNHSYCKLSLYKNENNIKLLLLI